MRICTGKQLRQLLRSSYRRSVIGFFIEILTARSQHKRRANNDIEFSVTHIFKLESNPQRQGYLFVYRLRYPARIEKFRILAMQFGILVYHQEICSYKIY